MIRAYFRFISIVFVATLCCDIYKSNKRIDYLEGEIKELKSKSK
jgi:hypothetical protein